MKTAAILAFTGISAIGGGVTHSALLAFAVVLVVAIIAVYLMLMRGIAPHIEWKSFKFSFKRLPRAPHSKE